jgi:hypothetical protein
MAWCEANRVDYLFGLARNARLAEHPVELAWAEDEAAGDRPPGAPVRRLPLVDARQLERRRRVVAKAEWTRRGRQSALRRHLAQT